MRVLIKTIDLEGLQSFRPTYLANRERWISRRLWFNSSVWPTCSHRQQPLGDEGLDVWRAGREAQVGVGWRGCQGKRLASRQEKGQLDTYSSDMTDEGKTWLKSFRL